MRILALKVFIIIFIAGAFVAMVMGIFWCKDLHSLMKNGIHTTGVVTRYWQTSEGHHVYTVLFEDINKHKITLDFRIQKDYAEVGDTLPIMYSRKAPLAAQIAHPSMHKFNCLAAPIFLLVIIAGLSWCFFKAKRIVAFYGKYGGATD